MGDEGYNKKTRLMEWESKKTKGDLCLKVFLLHSLSQEVKSYYQEIEERYEQKKDQNIGNPNERYVNFLMLIWMENLSTFKNLNQSHFSCDW